MELSISCAVEKSPVDDSLAAVLDSDELATDVLDAEELATDVLDAEELTAATAVLEIVGTAVELITLLLGEEVLLLLLRSLIEPSRGGVTMSGNESRADGSLSPA